MITSLASLLQNVGGGASTKIIFAPEIIPLEPDLDYTSEGKY